MKSLFFVLVLAFSLPTFGSTSEEIAQQIQSEFQGLQSKVSELAPEFTVAGYLYGKSYGDHELLWRLGEEPGDPVVIRIYREKENLAESLDVSFYLSHVIVPGRTVIRRFVGPARIGWRNDTVDAVSGEYIGQQGAQSPVLDARDQEILQQWGIRLFD